jgi:hypothetical protein
VFGTLTRNIIVVVVLLVSAGIISTKLYVEGKRAGVAETTVKWQEDKERLAKAYIEAVKAVREKEQQLQHQANVMRLEHQREIETLRRNNAAALASVQQRPQTRASEASPVCVTGGASSGVGSTGKELARPDAEFLIGYATEVAMLQQAYNECRQKYNALRDLLNK